MTERATGNGVVEFKDSAGAIKQRFQPLDAARAEVLSKPEALKAAKPPRPDGCTPTTSPRAARQAPPPMAPTGPPLASVPPGIGGTRRRTVVCRRRPTARPPAGSLPHPLGEPAQLPGHRSGDPTSAEPIRADADRAPPPTPSVPAAPSTPRRPGPAGPARPDPPTRARPLTPP
jgi:hypothetical protein